MIDTRVSLAKLLAWVGFIVGGAACVAGLWFGPAVSTLGLFVALAGAVLSVQRFVRETHRAEVQAFETGRALGRAEVAETEAAGKVRAVRP